MSVWLERTVSHFEEEPPLCVAGEADGDYPREHMKTMHQFQHGLEIKLSEQ